MRLTIDLTKNGRAAPVVDELAAISLSLWAAEAWIHESEQQSAGAVNEARDGILFSMTLKAHVHNGRLLVDEPTELPEGTEVELLPLDPGDWLNPADRAALHRALAASQEDLEAGRLVDAEEVLKELRAS